MKIKTFVRDCIPGPMYEKLRRLKSLLLLFVLFMKQDRRFSKNAALPGNMGQKQLETQLIFFSHQIEKDLVTVILGQDLVLVRFMPLAYALKNGIIMVIQKIYLVLK